MTLTTPRIAALVGAGILLLGLIVGLLPASAYGVNCGSAFAPSDEANVVDFADTLSGRLPRTGDLGGVGAACEDKRSDRLLIAVIIIGAGTLTTTVGLLSMASPSRGAARRE